MASNPNLGYTSLMRTLIATLVALMLFAATPVVAWDWEDGKAAYKAVKQGDATA